MSTAFELLRLSHIVVPWLVLARRLRKGSSSLGNSVAATPSVVSTEPLTAAKSSSKTRATQRKDKPKQKNKKKRQPAPPETDAAAPLPAAQVLAPPKRDHHTHRCVSCGAPVPLADAPFACPYCRAQIVPPPGVADAYRDIVKAKRALEHAERAWKRAILWGGPLWVILFALVIAVWSGGYLYLVIEASERRSLVPWTKLDRIVLMASAPSGIFGWWTGVMLMVNHERLRRIVGKVPRAAFNALAATSIACSHCGGDARFEEGRFTTLCGYCGAEEVRPTLAERASKQAGAIGKAAHFSMTEAYAAIVQRRETLLTYVDVMALGAVAFVGIDMLRWIPIVDKVFAFFE